RRSLAARDGGDVLQVDRMVDAVLMPGADHQVRKLLGMFTVFRAQADADVELLARLAVLGVDVPLDGVPDGGPDLGDRQAELGGLAAVDVDLRLGLAGAERRIGLDYS